MDVDFMLSDSMEVRFMLFLPRIMLSHHCDIGCQTQTGHVKDHRGGSCGSGRYVQCRAAAQRKYVVFPFYSHLICLCGHPSSVIR